MPKIKRVGLYVRVSTDQQTTANQRGELEAAMERHGWTVAAVFEDAGISGTKGRDRRPGLDGLLRAVARREIDVVAAWSVDRLGRSLQDLLGLLGELQAKRVDLYLHQQGIDTTTPAGKALFQMLGVFAEFERAMIQERVKAGLSRARAQGKRLGRPPVAERSVSRARQLRSEGRSYRQIASELGVSVGAIYGILRPQTAID